MVLDCQCSDFISFQSIITAHVPPVITPFSVSWFEKLIGRARLLFVEDACFGEEVRGLTKI